MKLLKRSVLLLFTCILTLSFGPVISAKAAPRNFAIGGYPADVKKINVKNQVTGVQGYGGMSFSGKVITVTIPSVSNEKPSYVEAYYTYIDKDTGAHERGTIYISIYYKSDKEPDLTHTSAQDALSDQYRAYLKTLDEENPAGYRFVYLASGQRGLVLISDDYLTARLTHKGVTLGSFQIAGTDGIPRKMLIQDIYFENDKPYIGLFVDNTDGQELSCQITPEAEQAFKDNGIQGIYLNEVLTDFE